MTTTTTQDEVHAGSGWRANLEIIAIGLGALMAALAQTLVLPVLPTISRDIGASTTEAQWLLTSTLLVGAAAVPVIGRLADMYGRRLMLIVALGALLVGSVIDALTDDIRVMILGRAITGLSSAAIPLGISLLSAVLPEARKGSAVALVSAMLGVGGALGLPLAGIVAEHFDYHALYWIGAVGALASIALVLAVVGNPRGERPGAIDVPGIVLLVGGLVCLVLPLSQGSSWGWGSFATIGLLVASVVLLALLVVVEKRSPDPLVDMRALSNPPVAITNVASIFVGFALFASFVGTANYVQAPEATGYGFGSSVLVAGLCLMPSGILMLLLAPVAARLMAAWGPGKVLFAGGLIIAAGLVVRIVLTDSLWQIILGSTIVGAGTGIAYASLPSLINVHTPDADLAAANGINTLARSLGSTLASAVGGSLLAAITVTVGGAALPSLGGYQILFTICAVAATLAALAGLVVSSPKLATHDREDVLAPV
ncbi:MFS transporter [Williamsia sp. Leaf354]|uniref:MFS transporter n=1 Tax=Williamsia sp. Leaf354 TaxID=1736349 RepID=UPI0006F2CCAF|nr:MFS transporter [Williamsia sp. Leaf354]KQS00917.1 MFS transporter [Williamsia sp. Leaf354]